MQRPDDARGQSGTADAVDAPEGAEVGVAVGIAEGTFGALCTQPASTAMTTMANGTAMASRNTRTLLSPSFGPKSSAAHRDSRRGQDGDC